MARDINLDTATTSVRQILKKYTDAQTPLYTFLDGVKGKEHKIAGGGETSVPVQVREVSALVEQQTGYESLNSTFRTGMDEARFKHYLFTATSPITELDKAENRKPESIIDAVAARSKNVMSASMREVNRQILTAQGSVVGNIGSLVDFAELLAPDAQVGVVGGLGKGTYPDAYRWKNSFASVDASGSGSFAQDGENALSRILRYMEAWSPEKSIDSGAGGSRGAGACHSIIMNDVSISLLEQSLRERIRYQNVSDVKAGESRSMYFAGAKVLYDVEMDRLVTPGTPAATDISAWFINFDGVTLAVDPERYFTMTDFVPSSDQNIAVARINFYGFLLAKSLSGLGVLADAQA